MCQQSGSSSCRVPSCEDKIEAHNRWKNRGIKRLVCCNWCLWNCMNEITFRYCAAQIFIVFEKAPDCIRPQWQNEVSSKLLSTNHRYLLTSAWLNEIAYMRLMQMSHPYKPESLPHTLDLHLRQRRDYFRPQLGALLIQQAIRSDSRESTKGRSSLIRDGLQVDVHTDCSQAIWVPLRELAFSSGRVWADALPLYTPTSCNPDNYQ